MKGRITTRKQAQRGQGMTEYVIIVGLVALLLIAAVRIYGQEIKTAIIGTGKEVDTNVTNDIGKDGSATIGGGGAGGGEGGGEIDPDGNPPPNQPPGGGRPGSETRPGNEGPGNDAPPAGGPPGGNRPPPDAAPGSGG